MGGWMDVERDGRMDCKGTRLEEAEELCPCTLPNEQRT